MELILSHLPCCLAGLLKDPLIHYVLPCSLEQLFKGFKWRWDTIKMIQRASGEVEGVRSTLEAVVRPGSKDGDTITFRDAGEPCAMAAATGGLPCVFTVYVVEIHLPRGP